MAENKDYEGEYEITPKLYEKITLPTTERVLTADIRVKKIPYREVKNSGGGETLIIGGE